MIDTKHWIIKIVPVLSFAAGVIMSAVGGVTIISSTAKLILFEQGPNTYINREDCRLDYSVQTLVKVDEVNVQQPRVRTEEEIDACLAQRNEQESRLFKNNEKQDIIDGLASLIVGLLLIFFFRKSFKK